ncbi:AI-2E family transporter [Roseomonas aerophila]|uniref:AI-2E family transporter n=1 Tax=Teichococcus aerophilus TaxID=1224513 RepID=A0ABR7RHR0_9PROT|nr:AI-2E family transporter [Pseudoroseomonas aerophila]MBC9206085.1 AI-2E family transporter [Pseudoroseomonas aerophila]
MRLGGIFPVLLSLGAGVLVLAGLHVAAPILAPVTFALFTIALVLPLQQVLERRLPRALAMLLTILATVAVVGLLGSMVVWGLTRVGHWLVQNSSNILALYAATTSMLDARGLDSAAMLAQQFDVSLLLRTARSLAGYLQGFVSFIALMVVFIVLGLLEVDLTVRKLAGIGKAGEGKAVLQVARNLAWKFQRYMLVRTAMSVATGICVFLFAWLFGLELALEWGVLAFVLNYIPFIGPLIATALPTLLALVQFGSVMTALSVLVGLNVIQNIIGSYVEPRTAGAALAVSPFIVLLSVFFWSFLWGVAGAFIGVPIVIALLTGFDAHPRTRWVAVLLSGSVRPEASHEA